MSKLKIVALISGGKDSFYSILHCLAQGHDVVALANLHPPLGDNTDDLDSFMYQTIGHNIIPLYEKALGLPLYRQAIRGGATNTNKTYTVSTPTEIDEPDETESLIPLLQQVIAAHPEVNAVSTGAILSDYQRTRVESVALRLALTPLAYLWQYPRIVTRSTTSLLEDMASAGQDARIIKVSSGALDKSFLWSNVADIRTITRLQRASYRFGDTGNGADLGEGGEYETLTIDGPMPLWKARIDVAEEDREIVPGEAGSAAVRVTRAQLSPKSAIDHTDFTLNVPALLEPCFSDLLRSLQHDDTESERSSAQLESINILDVDVGQEVSDLLLTCITGVGDNAAQQTAAIMALIEKQLLHAKHNIDNIAYTSIILRDMTDFAAVNAAYKASFIRPNPPARMTLAYASSLPADSLVSISVTSRKLEQPDLRQGLHVQSLSYWAPANIGPYSQAISLPISGKGSAFVVYIAGQIPLVPASLSIVGDESHDGFLQQTVLSLQHLHRIGSATSVQQWAHAVAFVVATDRQEAIVKANVLRQAWQLAYNSELVEEAEEFDEDFDVWHQRYGHQSSQQISQHSDIPSDSGRTIWHSPAPALHVFQVDSLPRQASVEWVAFGTTIITDPSPVVPHFQHILQVFSRSAL